MGLNPKQESFVMEYLKDFNATQAAIRAGYSEQTARQQGSDLLSKPDIQTRIDEHLKAASINTQRILGELSKIAFSDIQDYLTIDEYTGDVKAKALSEMATGATRAIESIEEDRVIKETHGETLVVHNKFKFKLHNKLKALELLLNHCKAGPVETGESKQLIVGGLEDEYL